ncbi:hypothetical protein PG987_009696 [Apiospora arundinis]
MVFELLRNLLWFIDRCYDPMRDRDGSYNSVHLQISEWGLRVQNMSHIPPKYGLFFPGPPQLRALEADSFIMLVTVLITCSFLSVFLLCGNWKQVY